MMTKAEAVKWLKSLKQEIGKPKNCSLWHYAEAIDMVIEVMSEPKTGEWETDMVYAGIEFYRCDQCDFRQSEKSRYCPNCGTKMYKDGEDE